MNCESRRLPKRKNISQLEVLGEAAGAYRSRRLQIAAEQSRISEDADATKRLLVELGARGSETPREENLEVWKLILKHLPERTSSRSIASGSLVARLAVKAHQLISVERERCVRSAIVVTDQSRKSFAATNDPSTSNRRAAIVSQLLPRSSSSF